MRTGQIFCFPLQYESFPEYSTAHVAALKYKKLLAMELRKGNERGFVMKTRLRDSFDGVVCRKKDHPERRSATAIPSSTRTKLRSGSCLQSPLENMQTFWGLVGAWWRSDKKQWAWSMASAIVITTVALTATGIIGAAVTGELIASFADVGKAAIEGNAQALSQATGEMGKWLAYEAMVGIAAVLINAARDITGKTMHRKWRNWLCDQLEGHLFENRRYVHLLYNRAGANDNVDRMPDNIDQRIQEAMKNMTGSVIGLGMGALGFTSAVIGFGGRLGTLSTSLPGLEMMGEWASATLAIGAAMLYVPLTTTVAYYLAKQLQRLTVEMQTTEGDYRAELQQMARTAEQIAASDSEAVEKKIINQTYEPVDATWRRFANATAIYAGFDNMQNTIATKLYSYLPAVPGLVSSAFTFAQFNEAAQLVSQLIVQASWPIRVGPDIANTTGNAQRGTELVEAMIRVNNAREHYARTGVAELQYATHENGKGVILENVELMHKGKKQAFLKADRIHFKPGTLTAVMGPSGCGKSTLVKTIMQLHPYGRGKITLPENATALNVALPGGRRALYATQETFLPDKISLKQLLCLPVDENDPVLNDVKVAAALQKVGLGKFIQHLKDDNYNGRCWKEVLSGGQKQLAVLARILLHKPDILILDEGVSALDAHTKVIFHELLKAGCPDTAVVSIIHDPDLLDASAAPSFYDELVLITQHSLSDERDSCFYTEHLDLRTPSEPRAAGAIRRPRPLRGEWRAEIRVVGGIS
jgi:ABC-type uncharacterized transport system fused permease/ATPase subunit